jgi:MFS family permease
MPSPLDSADVATTSLGPPPELTAGPATDRLRPLLDHLRAGRPAPALLTATGLFVVLVGVLLPMVDFFIVNVALPTIGRDLHPSPPLLELVVSGYATAYALLLILGGRLGDSLGRKRLFLLGMAAFTITSLACGLAPTALRRR